MSAKDIFHLIKEGWSITDDPLNLEFEEVTLSGLTQLGSVNRERNVV